MGPGGESGNDAVALPDDDVFCILPWVSLHVTTEGRVLPCCVADTDAPLGMLPHDRLPATWNGEPLRSLRRRMLAAEASEGCAKCYEAERSGFVSLRRNANATFAHHAPVVSRTSATGDVAEFRLAFLDIRFSNVCNMACLTCGPRFSTSWYRYAPGAHAQPVRRPFTSDAEMLAELTPLLESVEQVYFAGGEPALMAEHYLILERLVAMRRTDVRLSYSTNFSALSFRRWDLAALWRHFPSVSVGASLDACEARAEYLRNGVPWERIVANRRRQLDECPHVQFCVTTTLGNLNALHVPDFHEAWVAERLIDPGQVFLNILQAPPHYRLTTLTPELKERVRARFERHIAFLRSHAGSDNAVRGFASALRFMDSEDSAVELAALRREIHEQDALRGTSVENTFPELRPIFATS